MNVGEYIKKLRIEAGLSQEELGKQLGVQRAAVQKWECGRVQNLKRDIIKKLAIIFNVPPASFIDVDSTDLKMHIGDIIRNKRTELGLTMLDVAKQVGVSEGTISRWESGSIANMRRDKIAALAKTLKLSPSVITDWSNDEDDSFDDSLDPARNNSVGVRENIRKNLGYYLTLKKMSQKELAEKLGVSQASVTCWIKGKNSPDIEAVAQICKILNITVTDLFGTNERKLPDIFYRYDELSNDRQQEVIAFMEFKIAQQEKETKEIMELAKKAEEESDNYAIKKALAYIDEQIAKGEFDPRNARIAAYEGDIISPDKEREEWAADVMRLARLIEEEQSKNGDK